MRAFKYSCRTVVVAFAICIAISGISAQTDKDVRAIYNLIVREMKNERNREYAQSTRKPGKFLYFLSTSESDDIRDQDSSKTVDSLDGKVLKFEEHPKELSKLLSDPALIFVDQREIEEMKESSMIEWKAMIDARPRSLLDIPFQCGDDWKHIHKKYPEASRIYYLSQVALDARRRSAFLKVGWNSGCANLNYAFYLDKKNGKWHITDSAAWGGIS